MLVLEVVVVFATPPDPCSPGLDFGPFTPHTFLGVTAFHTLLLPLVALLVIPLSSFRDIPGAVLDSAERPTFPRDNRGCVSFSTGESTFAILVGAVGVFPAVFPRER